MQQNTKIRIKKIIVVERDKSFVVITKDNVRLVLELNEGIRQKRFELIAKVADLMLMNAQKNEECKISAGKLLAALNLSKKNYRNKIYYPWYQFSKDSRVTGKKSLFKLFYINDKGEKTLIEKPKIRQSFGEAFFQKEKGLFFDQEKGKRTSRTAYFWLGEYKTTKIEFDPPFYTYKEHFEVISRLRQNEFNHLDDWIDLYAIDTRLSRLQEQVREDPVIATELINKCVNTGENIIVFGESGSGKTFTCLKLFEAYKENYLHKGASLTERIPLLIELSRTQDKKLEKVIKENIDDKQFAKDKNNYIIFLDGLNESGTFEDQKRVFFEIERFSTLNPETRLIVSTQTISEHHLKSGFKLYEIQPFRKEDVIDYLCKFQDKFASKKEAETFYDNLPELIKAFVSIPVFLYLLVSTYEKGKQVIVSTPGELIGQYENFLCGYRKSRPLDMDKEYRYRVIPFIAFNMCINNEIDITFNRFNEYVHMYNKETPASINEREVRDVITNRFRLIKRNEKDDFRFIFQIIRDYFAAIYIKHSKIKPKNIFELIYSNNKLNDDIANALKLLVSIVDPEIANSFVHKFIEKDIYLACDMFAWSTIDTYDAEFLFLMRRKIDIYSREYLFNINVVITFYLKMLDLIQRAGKLIEPMSADYYQDLGASYLNRLNHDRATESYKKAIQIYEINNMQNNPKYPMLLSNLACAYDNKLDNERALEIHKKAIKVFEKNKLRNHPNYAQSLMNAGNSYAYSFEFDNSLRAFEKAIKIYENNNMHNHPECARSYMNLGLTYRDISDNHNAIIAYKKTIAIYEKINMHNHPDFAESYMNLGLSYCETLDYDNALEAYNKAIDTYKKNYMQTHPKSAKCLMNLGNVYLSQSNFNKSLEIYQKSLNIYEKNNMQTHPDYAICLTNLGSTYHGLMSYALAMNIYNEAITVYEMNNMHNHPEYALCLANSGSTYDSMGKKEKAIQIIELSLSILEGSVGKNHAYYNSCMEMLIEINKEN